MEAETIITIGEKVEKYAVEPIGRQLGYLFFYNNNVAKLKNQVEKLGHTKQRVQHSVDEAKRKGEEIEKDVEKWLETEDSIVAKANKLIEDASKAKTSCSNWSCPNLKSRHQLSRKASKMVVAVSKIEEEGKSFHAKGVSYRVAPQGIGNTSIKGYEAFESRRSTLKGVIEALKSDNINMIGVYGMGGIGKTMLVKEVAKQVKQDNLFDKVVVTVVSQTPDFKKIQVEIADMLGLKFDNEESIQGRAYKLHERLKTEKKILVIIDDIWDNLDLEAVGLSFGDDQKQSKLLFTSRFEDVLRNDMGIQNIFHLGVLWDDESINLFRNIVGSLAEDQAFDPVAVDVVKECAGLPIAITTVANALKNEKLYVWKNALLELRSSNPRNIKGMPDKVYQSIALSYNFLRSEEAKSLLLLCSLHEEDANIKVDSLLRYGIGLDLFQGVNHLEAVGDRVRTLVDILKSSCLLLNGDYHDTVKMHDVIRDVAIHIAANDKRMLVIGNDVVNLQEQSKKKKLKDSTAISLPYTNVCELPERLECPQLMLFLLFNHYYRSLQIPHPFFEGMKELRVLNLTRMRCPHLPSSLSFLQNLQTLCLDNCELEDIALIGELKELKVLSLSSNFKIEQLPEQISQLTHLQVLDLSGCSHLKVIPPNILSNLKMLEELYMKVSFTGWEVEGQSSEGSNARVTELDHLSRLTTLEIDIPSTKILPKALIFEKLVRYKISIGDHWSEFESFKTSKALKLKLDISFQSVDGIRILLKSCKELYLGELKGVQNILYELNSDGFPLLKHLEIEKNDEIQYIIYSMGPPAFPVLESINLFYAKNLENICHGLLAVGSFRNLREVKVKGCDKLKFVFSSSMAGCLPQLQRIEIRYCKVMGSIVGTEREDEIEISYNGTTDVEFPQLCSLVLSGLPKLTCFFDIDVESRGVLFNVEKFPQLRHLELENLPKLTCWFGCDVESRGILFSEKDTFANLEDLSLSYCSGLKNLLSSSTAKSLVQLKEMSISKCKNITEIVGNDGGECDAGDHPEIVFNQLTSLKLGYLPSLTSFNPGNCKMIFPSLNRVEVTNCPELKIFNEKDTFANLEDLTVKGCGGLKNLLSSSTAKSLVQLRKMSIRDCKNITEIVGNEGGECDAGDHSEIVFNQLTSLELKNLPILTSFHPGNCTMIFPSLNSVVIYDCSEWKIFSQGVLSMPTLSTLRINGLHGQFYRINEMDNLNVLYQLNSNGFPLLKHLEIHNYKIQYIINSMRPPPAFPVLESSNLYNVISLENICHGLLVVGSFCNLREVKVVRCDKLKFVFSSSMAGCLPQLQRIDISVCEVMGSIVGMEREDEIEISNNGTMLFPELRSVKLENLPELTCWFGCDVESRGILLNEKDTFANLEHLTVEGCAGLKNLLSSSTAKSLVQLRKMSIRDCENITEIVGKEGGECDARYHSEIVFNQLTSLELTDLPILTSFHPGNCTMIFPSLNSVVIYHCSELKIFSRGVLSMPMLSTLEIKGHDSQFYRINEKDDLNILYELNLDGFPLLKHLKIHYNYKIQYIINSMRPPPAYPVLESIDLKEVINLENICHGLLAVGSFQNLRTVNVERCDKLKFVFSSSMAGCLLQLQEINISECKVMGSIVGTEREDEIEISNNDTMMFPQLRSLRLWYLPELTCFGFDVKSRGILFNEKDTFANLEDLTVKGCGRLKNLLSSSTAKSLVQLRKMSIRDCKNITEIVGNEGGECDARDHSEIVFNQLTYLELTYLPILTSFHPGNCTMIFPSLNSVVICLCSELKIFSQGVLSMPTLSTLRINGLHGPCYRINDMDGLNVLYQLNSNGFSLLKHLEIKYIKIQYIINSMGTPAFLVLESINLSYVTNLENICRGPLAVGSFRNLREAYVQGCDKLKFVFSSSMAGCLPQLQRIDISWCEVMGSIVGMEREDEIEISNNGTMLFPELRSVKLENLPELTCWFGCDVESRGILLNEKDTFANLEDLTVWGCGGLKNLLSSSTAKSLVQLKKMSISRCESITKIVGNEGGECDAGDHPEIVFNQLKSLELKYLPRLTNFHPGNCTMIFPSLNSVEVTSCLELKIFSQGVLSTPKLSMLLIEGRYRHQFYPKRVDLNNSIKQAWEKCNQENDQSCEEEQSWEEEESWEERDE